MPRRGTPRACRQFAYFRDHVFERHMWCPCLRCENRFAQPWLDRPDLTARPLALWSAHARARRRKLLKRFRQLVVVKRPAYSEKVCMRTDNRLAGSRFVGHGVAQSTVSGLSATCCQQPSVGVIDMCNCSAIVGFSSRDGLRL